MADGQKVTGNDLLYSIIHLGPLIRSSEWDDVKEQVKISLEVSAALQGLCDEPNVVRSYLPKTSEAIVCKWSPTSDAIFCLKQMVSDDIKEDFRVKFANLLTSSLLYADRWPILIVRLEQLLAQPTICQKIPDGTIGAIRKFLSSTHSGVYGDHLAPATSTAPEVFTAASGRTPTPINPSEDTSIDGETQLQPQPEPLQRCFTVSASIVQPILSISQLQSHPLAIRRRFTAPASYGRLVISDIYPGGSKSSPEPSFIDQTDVSKKYLTAAAGIKPEPTQDPTRRGVRNSTPITPSRGGKPSINLTPTPPRRPTVRETASTSAHSSAGPKIHPRTQPRPTQRQFLTPTSDSRRPTPSPVPSNGSSQKETTRARIPIKGAKPTSSSKPPSSSFQSSFLPAAKNPLAGTRSSQTSYLKNRSVIPGENKLPPQPASVAGLDESRNSTRNRTGKGKDKWK